MSVGTDWEYTGDGLRRISFAILVLMIMISVFPKAKAMEFTAPAVPEQGQEFMPADTESFSDGLWYVLKKAVAAMKPELAAGASNCYALIAVVLLVSLAECVNEASKRVVELVGVLAIGCLLLEPSNSLITLGVQTVEELSQYGKLLLPVMTAALAAEGGVTASGALYAGSAFMLSLLSAAVSGLIVPMLWVYLCLCVANNTVGNAALKNLSSFVKWSMTWTLKIILYVFTGYMGITGIVTGTTDAAALKATKLAISGVVPVVGGILSDASEAVLVGAGVMKSAAGIYGLLAVISVCIGPFLKIGIQYLLLKVTAGVCSVFGHKRGVQMIKDFSATMGYVVAMTGTVCLLLMISAVCIMKGLNG